MLQLPFLHFNVCWASWGCPVGHCRDWQPQQREGTAADTSGWNWRLTRTRGTGRRPTAGHQFPLVCSHWGLLALLFNIQFGLSWSRVKTRVWPRTSETKSGWSRPAARWRQASPCAWKTLCVPVASLAREFQLVPPRAFQMIFTIMVWYDSLGLQINERKKIRGKNY